MQDDPNHTPADRTFASPFPGGAGRPSQSADSFKFLLNSLAKRFPERSRPEIDDLLGKILRRMAPSRDRVRLNRQAIHALKHWRENGQPPAAGSPVRGGDGGGNHELAS